MRVAPRSALSTVVVVIVLVVVLAAAATGVFFATRQSTPATSTSTSNTVQQTTTSASMPTSFTGTTTTSTATTPITTAVTTASLTSCEATVTQTTNTEVNQLQAAFNAISEYRALSYGLNITSQSTTTYETFGYSVTPAVGGLEEVNITTSVARNSTSGLTSDVAWVNVDSMSVINITEYVTSHGTRYSLGTQTGVEAESMFTPVMSEFSIYNTEYGAEYYSYFTDTQYFHSTGTASMTFGPTTFDVTTYVANSTPETFNACGNVFNLDQWTLQLGTPPGTSAKFVTYIHSEGSEVVNGVTETNDFTLALTSLTVA